jgi:pimeloyl-ACP methyl ester carboxylesterase
VPLAQANGIDLYYERRGSGPRLLYCNGSGATLAQSGVLIDGFAVLFDVLAYDARGMGKSSRPQGTYEMADCAADAVALLDALGWGSCRMVGTSFGGMVAQEVGVTWPERVERLALLSSSPGGAYRSYPLETLADLPVDEATAKGAPLIDSRFTPGWLIEHPVDRSIVDMMISMRETSTDPEVRRGEAAQLDARSRFDALDRLERISCPTLVANGRYDQIAPPANAEAIASRVPGADLRLYEGGHLFFLQDAKAAPEIMAFLQGD